MTKSESSDIKPWPIEKRISMAVGWSLRILMVAIILGGGAYWWGREMNWIKSQSIKELVMERALEDPELADKFIDSIKYEECRNQAFGFSLSYTDRFQPTTLSGQYACREFGVINSQGKMALIKITPWPVTKTEAIEVVLSGMDRVSTDDFPHEMYEGVKIGGQKIVDWASVIVISPSEQESVVFELTNSDSVTERLMEQLARSYKKM